MNQPSQLHSVKSEPPSRPQPEHGNGGGNGRYGERIARIESRMEFVATREDIADLKTRFAELDTRFAELDTRFAEIKILIAKTDSALLKWLIGIVVTVAVAIATAGIYAYSTILRLLAG